MTRPPWRERPSTPMRCHVPEGRRGKEEVGVRKDGRWGGRNSSKRAKHSGSRMALAAGGVQPVAPFAEQPTAPTWPCAQGKLFLQVPHILWRPPCPVPTDLLSTCPIPASPLAHRSQAKLAFTVELCLGQLSRHPLRLGVHLPPRVLTCPLRPGSTAPRCRAAPWTAALTPPWGQSPQTL